MPWKVAHLESNGNASVLTGSSRWKLPLLHSHEASGTKLPRQLRPRQSPGPKRVHLEISDKRQTEYWISLSSWAVKDLYILNWLSFQSGRLLKWAQREKMGVRPYGVRNEGRWLLDSTAVVVPKYREREELLRARRDLCRTVGSYRARWRWGRVGDRASSSRSHPPPLEPLSASSRSARWRQW